MCVWNKGRPGECLDTDCASHRYVYASHSSATERPAQAVLDSAIADLEREIKDQQWMIDNYSGHHKEIHESISKALRYSLNLLRGGAHD